ncbi:hypothetical protein QL995_18765 [Pseudoalteromonas sp. APC 3358]|uniref:hypothetical protein n=1 Tax=Pseudoalteromonas sp. APC 3358 TaxID=3035176 RepID=UPI0025B3CA38|nr:hypothetical protein [Pseudoalteromonas sp. APC 3358]MDN3384682.1 hypothetical protein [Pseudoalteromonas sp. APC 3358]
MLVKLYKKTIPFSEIVLFSFFSIYIIGNGQHNKKFLFLFFSYLLFINIKNIVNLSKITLLNWPFILVIIWCFITSLWSIWPSESRYTSITQVLLLFTCVLVTYSYTVDRILLNLKLAAILFIIVNLVYFFIAPLSFISLDGAKGITNHKNSFGFIIAISIIIIFSYSEFKILNLKIYDKLYLCVALVFLLLSLSKTSISLVFISIIVTYLLSKIDNKNLILVSSSLRVFSLPFVFFLFTIIYIYQYEITDYLYYHYNDDFLTGRGRIWMTLILDNVDRMNFGLGFGSVWDKGEYSEIFFTDIYETDPLWAAGLASSDGGYTDLLLSIGIVGVGIFTYFLLTVLAGILLLRESKAFFLILPLYIFIILHNITETSFLLGSVSIWFIFVLISCIANHRKI